MKKTISLVLVLSWALTARIVKADFVFGTQATEVPNVNSSSCDACIAISPDGLELYFLSNRPHGTDMDYCDIWVARRKTKDCEWGTPVNLGPSVNSSAWEGDPSFSANGLEMYFGDGGPPLWSGFTHKPGGCGGSDIWVSTRVTKNDPWGEPEHLGSIINTSAFESDPTFTADGLEMFFGSDRRRSGDVEIYVTTRATTSDPWGEPMHLGPTINPSSTSIWWDGDPEISPDGLTLFFDSWRPGGYGENDLYVTTRATRDDEWGPAINLGPNINSAYSEGDPSLSTDGSILYFIRGKDSDFSSWNLWQVPIVSIFKAHNPTPSDGAILRDTWLNLSWSPGHTSGDSRDVYLGENFDDVAAGIGGTFQGNQAGTNFTIGFPGFPYPDGLVSGTTYYWRIDEIEADGTMHEGKVWSFTIAPKTATRPEPSDRAEFVDPDEPLSWEPGYGAILHYVYFGDNFDDVNNATGGSPQGIATYKPDTLKLAQTYYWRVDEFDAITTHKGDVWSFTTDGTVKNTSPSNGAVNVKQTQILSWSPGVYAASHQVYFGTDKEAVGNANTTSPEYKSSMSLGSESYDPGILECDTTYYWRIDEINNINLDSPWLGNIWSFTTADFLIVDDFEDYDNYNQIWWAWHDGVGYVSHPTEAPYAGNGTGSMIGNENAASYTEEHVVHGGKQSMPVFYDNSVLGYSEVEKKLIYPCDWTDNSVDTLTIWFRGSSANSAETLYVVLNSSVVVSHDNPNATQIDVWTKWNINLQTFADQGINLANVDSITLGLGNRNSPVAGGSGTMYFDDICLHRLTQ